jgi:Sec-independent protein translocase protein TatA
MFENYLAMGPSRSLKKLANELRSKCGDDAPTQRTLETWSSRHGWDRKAKQFDHDEAERAKYQLLIHRANVLEERRSIQLDHAMLLHTTFRDGMTRLEHHTEVAEDGSITQEWDERVPIPADHIPVARGYFYMAAEKQATAIEHLVLGTAATDRDVYEERMGQEGPAITVLGPEAMQELGLKVGKLVRQLAKTTEARRAERELEIIDQEPNDEPAYESADDPGLQWEEITDDDE